jgi:hypothetical protein
MMDGGFLADPKDSLYGDTLKHLKSTDDLDAKGVLVLLGEAGLGKTVEVRRLAGTNSQVLDLGQTNDEQILERELTSRLLAVDPSSALVLDALDEALVGIPKASEVILRCLRSTKGPIPRIVLTCRTGAWPVVFGAQLASLVGDAGKSEYELCMLTRNDASIAAEAEGLNSNAFIQAIADAGVEPLAASPTTLNLLIKLFGKNSLPQTRAALYESALLKLCEQPAERRERSEPREGSRVITPADMLATATRIAAMTVLSGRSQISALGLGEADDGSMHFSEFAGGHERIGDGHGQKVEITEQLVRETLKHTGLFSARAASTFGFAHKSYAEFLTARFIARAKLHPLQLASLLFTDGISGRRVIPQLSETAGWLADLDPTFRRELIVKEPGVLLHSDLRAWPSEVKRDLIESLLGMIRRGELTDLDAVARKADGVTFGASYRQVLRQLNHDGLSDQLSHVIADRLERESVRDAALDLARACKVATLGPICATVALDETASRSLRTAAASTVRAAGGSESCQLLLPLIHAPGDDPSDDIKGCALAATWPRHLGLLEMLVAITPPKRSNYHGYYAAFLHNLEIPVQIAPHELVEALEWAKSHPDNGDVLSVVGAIASDVAYAGWLQVEKPEVCAALARLILTRIDQNSVLFRAPQSADGQPRYRRDQERATAEVIQIDDSRRRRLVEACLTALTRPEDAIGLAYARPRLNCASDFEWAIRRVLELPAQLSEPFAHFARTIGVWSTPSSMDLWLQARQQSEVIRRVLDYPIQTVLASPDAKRAWWRWARERAGARVLERRRSRRRPTNSPIRRTLDLLEHCEDKDVRWWVKLAHVLQCDDEWEAEHSCQLTESPGWKRSDEATRARITAAARRYLAECQIEGTGRSDPGMDSMAAGHAALLLDVRGESIEALGRERLAAVAPILVVALPCCTSNSETCVGIAQTCLRLAPAESGSALVRMIRSARGGHLSGILQLDGLVVPDSVKEQLLDVARSEMLEPKVLPSLLAWLVEARAPGAIEYAVSLLENRVPESDLARQRAKVAAECLLKFPDRGWFAIWRSVRADVAWGDELLLSIAPYDAATLPRLGIAIGHRRLGIVVEYMMDRFRPEDDSMHGDMDEAGGRAYGGRWRDELMNELVSAGTADAIAEIRWMRDRWPTRAWLSRALSRAETSYARTSWRPIPPRHLLQLREDAQRRSVRNGGELLSVLVESLHRFEAMIREHDTVELLWNQCAHQTWKPKDEASLSNAMCMHLHSDLKQRGLVLGRELQISQRRSQFGAAGMRLDIAITAVPSPHDGGRDELKAVIEVKGSWNTGAGADLQAQLVDRYLREHGAAHGLFVVGWFAAQGWDRHDSRRRTGPWRSIEEARIALSQQAADACSARPGVVVQAAVLDFALR